MNVFSFADTDGDSKIVLDSVCAEALREGSYKVVTFDGKYNALSWLKFEDCDCVKSKRDNNSSIIHIIQKGEKGWKICRDIAKNFTLNFLPVLFVQKEIIPFFRLPIVDDGEDVPIFYIYILFHMESFVFALNFIEEMNIEEFMECCL